MIDSKNLRFEVSNILLEIGIPSSLSGAKYLVRAVQIAMKNKQALLGLRKLVYPVIALEFETRPANVERAIRRAIEIASNKNKIVKLNQIFNLEIYLPMDRPSNSEFIALLCNRIFFILKKQNYWHLP